MFHVVYPVYSIVQIKQNELACGFHGMCRMRVRGCSDTELGYESNRKRRKYKRVEKVENKLTH